MTAFTTVEWIAGGILIGVATASLFSTVTTIYLIKIMNRWNGYLLMIFTLTIYQLLYDLAFFFVPFYQNKYCNKLTFFLTIFGGLAVTFWTNVISVVLYLIVQRLASYDIKKYYHKINILIFIPSFTLGLVQAIYKDEDSGILYIDLLYIIIRIISIGFNLLIHCLVSYKLYNMGFNKYSYYSSIIDYNIGSRNKNNSTYAMNQVTDSIYGINTQNNKNLNSINADGSPVGTISPRRTKGLLGSRGDNRKAPIQKHANNPVLILASRLKYYPIVQIITISGTARYELRYSLKVSSYHDPGMPLSQKISLCFYAVSCPIAGLGYFLIFLLFQPLAYRLLMEQLKLLYTIICCQSKKEDKHDSAVDSVLNSEVFMQTTDDEGSPTRSPKRNRAILNTDSSGSNSESVPPRGNTTNSSVISSEVGKNNNHIIPSISSISDCPSNFNSATNTNNNTTNNSNYTSMYTSKNNSIDSLDSIISDSSFQPKTALLNEPLMLRRNFYEMDEVELAREIDNLYAIQRDPGSTENPMKIFWHNDV